MSSFYECSTPQSMIHLETNDSDDVSEYFVGDLYEKHADSIMPTEKMQELMGRRMKEMGKKVGRAEIGAVIEGFKQRIGRILQNFIANQETFKKIYEGHAWKELKTPEKVVNGRSFENEEEKIRERLKKNHLFRMSQIKKKIEDEKNKAIDVKRDDLQKYWRTKMFELNGKLQQAEWKKTARKGEEKEKVKDFYQKVYEVALKKEKKLLECDIDEHYSAQFQEKLKRVKKGFEEFRNRCRKEYEERMNKERTKWVLEDRVKEKIIEKVEIENLQVLKKAQKEIKRKVEIEGEVMLKLEAEEIDKKIKEFCKSVKDSQKTDKKLYKQWIAEAKLELKHETLQKSAVEYKNSLIPVFSKEISRSLNLTTHTKVLKNEQEKLFKSVSEELNLTFEYFKKETENFYRKETSEIESDYLKNLQNTVELKAKQKLLIKEKEIHIKYIKKSEILKNELKKDFEEKISNELKKNKENLIREKTLLAQFKAKNNIHIARIEEEIENNEQKLEEDTIRLELKLRELNQKSKNEDEIVFKTEDVIAKSSKHGISASVIPLESFKELNPFFILPSFSAKEIRVKTESNLRSPKIDVNAQALKPSYHVSNKSTFQEGSNSNSMSFDCLKFKTKSKEKVKSHLVKQSMYHELLKEKFGFIKPRLK